MIQKHATSKDENDNRTLPDSLTRAEFRDLFTSAEDSAPGAIHKFRLDADGTTSMPFCTPAIEDIYGIPAAELMEDFAPAWDRIHPDDQPRISGAIQESARTMEDFHCQWRVQHPDKGEILVDCLSIPEAQPDNSIIWYGYLHDITALKRAEQDRLAHMYFVVSMDKVNRAIQGAGDLEAMMSNVLELLLNILGCDRAWLVYPCDPGAETWRMPMERSRPEYPCGRTENVDFPMSPDVAESMRLCLQSDAPITIGSGADHSVLPNIAREYEVQALLAMTLYPKVGKPWMFGMHQYSYPRFWTTQDTRLFSEIGRRLSDALSSLLVLRDLRESEERFRHAFEFAGIGMGILAPDGRWLRANRSICEMLDYSEDELRRTSYQELTHPDDLLRGKEDAQRVLAGEIPRMQIEKRYRHRDGHYIWARLTTSIVRSEDDAPLYFVSQIENIDERKRAEHQNVLLISSLNRVQESVFLTDAKGRFKFVNEEACRMLGYSHDELLGMTVPDIGPEHPLERWREHWRDLAEKGSLTLETVQKTKSGRVIPVEVSANYFEHDGIGYNLALVRDITERKRAEEALRRSEADLQLALDVGHLGDWKWDTTTDEIKCSPRCRAIYGFSDDEKITYEKFLGMVHQNDRDKVDSALKIALTGGDDFEVEKRIVRPDGTERWAIIRGRAIFDDARDPALMAGITLDITERKLAEQARRVTERALRESDERFRQMAENIPEVFWLTDVATGNMLYINPAYETVWGRTRESLFADPEQWIEAIHPDDRQRIRNAAENRQAPEHYDLEYRVIRPDGSIRHIHDRASPIRDDEGNVYRVAGIAQDVTSRKKQEERIHYLAYHDALTGLPNRALMMDRLGQAIEQAHRHRDMLAVLFFDVDRFKTINDTLGHQAGDFLLKQAGTCLSKVLREQDTVARVGGDEFLILLPDVSIPDDAAHVARKILESFSAPMEVADHVLHVTASIGISIYPRDTDEAETLVKFADSALYLAKEHGRNTFRFFSPELDAGVRTRLHLENDLRGAIARDELLLRYQPIMDPATGQFEGAEALVSWQHPEHGLLGPADFVPIAEESGLIMQIGEWVLRSAASQARKWQDAGNSEFRVCVNLSRRQLDHPDLADTMQRILEETGCDPHLLELEITESSTMNEPEQAIAKLLVLHEMGIGLALDDFGTGYSSLSYLKRFPLDRLKIDRSFVKGIPDDHDDMAIVQATIVLAHQLNLSLVAEGVETEAQSAFLESKGCNEIQGSLIASPMSPEDLAAHCGL